jgi:hypothetical protein
MKLQIFSDLHLDVAPLKPITIAESVDAVIVAGDTWEGAVRTFEHLRWIVPVAIPIVMVMGTAQIKEKYGTQRFYWQGSLSADAVARVEEAIALAEARSATTCDVCGEEGQLHDDLWLVTRCDAHAEGRPAVAVEEGFENLRVERTMVGGRVHVRYRRYDRGTDRFVDVAPVARDSQED